MSASKKRNRFGAQDWLTSAEHGEAERREIRGRRKQAGMSRDSAHHAGVFILHLTLNDSLAEAPIVCGRRDLRFPCLRRIEHRSAHSHPRKDFPLTKLVERFSGDSFEGDPEQNETDVAVLGVRARRVLERN